MTQCRLARRLLDLQLLPYLVVTNPHIKRVYNAYYHAFETLRATPEVSTLADNAAFCTLLRRLVDEHGRQLLLLPESHAHQLYLVWCASQQMFPRCSMLPTDNSSSMNAYCHDFQLTDKRLPRDAAAAVASNSTAGLPATDQLQQPHQLSAD